MKRKNAARIFVVEDNPLYQELIAKQLESLACDLHFYTQGEQCLEEMDKNPSTIILDYNLEGEINGLDTLFQIRRKNGSVNVILFTDQKNVNTRENLNRYGRFIFLEKKRQSFGKLKKLVYAATGNEYAEL